MNPKSMRVGMVQSCAGPDAGKNIDAVRCQIKDAAASGARLIALPEAVDFLHPDTAEFGKYAEPLERHQAALAFREVASEVSAWILVGSISVRSDAGAVVNRSLLISPQGEVRATYDKINLFDASPGPEASRESDLYRRGTIAIVAQADVVTLGLSVCYDLRFPLLYRALAQQGANVLAVPSAFMKITGEAHWHTLLRARAIETGCYVIAPAQCGSPHAGRESFGHSLVVNPWGEVIAEAGIDPQVITADLDLDQVTEARRRIPSLSQNFDFAVRKV